MSWVRKITYLHHRTAFSFNWATRIGEWEAYERDVHMNPSNLKAFYHIACQRDSEEYRVAKREWHLKKPPLEQRLQKYGYTYFGGTYVR